MDKRPQTAWLVALMLGAVAGVWGLLMPVTGLVLTVAATLLALLRHGPRLFGLGGVWLGFGGIWAVFLGRAGFECGVAPPPSDGCSSPLFQTYLVVGILLAAAGLLATSVAFRASRTP